MANFSIVVLDTGTPKLRTQQSTADIALTDSPLLVNAGTHTSAIPALDISQTWDNGAVPFTGMKVNVTNTASAAGALLADFQVGGVSKFRVDKDGSIYTGYTTTYSMTCSSYLFVGASGVIGFNGDTQLQRDAANTLALRNGTNAQQSRVYGTYTDGSNYRRIAKGMSTAGVAYLRPEGAGTGASGNVLHISGLPTSNPGPGILWNNAGSPAIGT